MIKYCLALVVVLLSVAGVQGPLRGEESQSVAKVVRVEQVNNRWQLTRGDQPYYINGAGGPGSLKLLAASGGNSTRMWGVGDDTGKRLDEAHQNGISVALGIWLEHERKGFDYSDADQLADQTALVLDAVRKYKDHPAVLLWGIGNEMEGYESGDSPAIWSHVEQLCQLIKQEDQSHPTMSVIAEIGGNRIAAINEHCPSLDIIGINAYAGAATLPRRYRQAGGAKPYIVTEFGPAGAWETEHNNIGAVVENTSNEKAKQYAQTWQSLSQDREFCLGSYAFLWGHKLEATATWFGLLLEDGRKTNAVDELQRLWTGSPPKNRCPDISSLRIVGTNQVDAESHIKFELAASDPEAEELAVEWLLLPESDTYDTAGDFQSALQPITDRVVRSDAVSAEFRAPVQSGLYRLYAIVGDNQSAAAVANVPFRVRHTELDSPGTKVTLPFVIYDEANEPTQYAAAGRIGQPESVVQDPTCATEPKFGRTCLSCGFAGGDSPGGIIWQHPESDSGDLPGGFDLTGAKRITVWAKGQLGGEKLTIGFGNQREGIQYPDTAARQETILLTRHWKKFQIHIAHADLRRIKTGFCWSVENSAKPVNFFLDRIAFE